MTTGAETVSSSPRPEGPGCGYSGRAFVSILVVLTIGMLIFAISVGWMYEWIFLIAFSLVLMTFLLITYGCVTYISRREVENNVPRNETNEFPEIPSVSRNLAFPESDPPPDYETVQRIEYGWKRDI